MLVEPLPREAQEGAPQLRPSMGNDRIRFEENRAPAHGITRPSTRRHQLAQLHAPLHGHAGHLLNEMQQVADKAPRQAEPQVGTAPIGHGGLKYGQVAAIPAAVRRGSFNSFLRLLGQTTCQTRSAPPRGVCVDCGPDQPAPLAGTASKSARFTIKSNQLITTFCPIGRSR